MNLCPTCDDPITARQHQLECSQCSTLLHRKCGDKSMTSQTYHNLKRQCRAGGNYLWRCQTCKETNPDHPFTPPGLPQAPVPSSANNISIDLNHIHAMPVHESTREEDMDTTGDPMNLNITAANFSLNISDLSSNLNHPTAPTEIPSRHEESVMDTPMLTNPAPKSVPEVTFSVLQNGTKRGAPLLIDTASYTYNVKRRYPKTGRVLWCCSVRNQHNTCGATVSQNGDTFVQNSGHNHPSNPGADHAAIINARCIVIGRDQVFTSAGAIALEAMKEHFSDGVPLGAPKCLT